MRDGQQFGRRAFLARSLAVASSIPLVPASGSGEDCEAGLGFPLEDLHVHLTREFTLDRAAAHSKRRGVKFGIVQHPGARYRLIGDDDPALQRYIDQLSQYPVYKGVQPVSPGWKKDFTKKTLSQLDYVIMDAMELPNKDGTFFRIWRQDTVVENKEAFMERYTEFYERILAEESINVLASPTFMPASLRDEYDALWTHRRRQRIIDAAVKHRVAIEINSMYKIPSKEFVLMAKAAGARFTFGTNGRTEAVAGHLDYSIKMARCCGLTKSHMFSPGAKVEARG